jgi:hypothetical protein
LTFGADLVVSFFFSPERESSGCPGQRDIKHGVKATFFFFRTGDYANQRGNFKKEKKRKKSERESQTGLGMDIKSHQFFAFSLHLPMMMMMMIVCLPRA